MAKPQDTGTWTPDIGKIKEPSTGRRLAGWIGGQKPPSQYFNWMWNGVLSWTNWLANISVDQGTDLSSWDINKGLNLSNNGVKVHTSNCNNVNISATSSRGVVTDSESMSITNSNDFEIRNSEQLTFIADNTDAIKIKNSNIIEIGEAGSNSSNIEVLNSDSGTVAGTDLKVENSIAFDVKGTNNSIKNCTSVIIQETVTRSSIENVDIFEEARSNTKTVADHRILGSKIVKKVFDDEPILKLGQPDQRLFGNRYLSHQADVYWTCEGADPAWREANIVGHTILNGTQNLDAMNLNSVSVGSGDTAIFPIQDSGAISFSSNMISMWIKTKTGIGAANSSVCHFSFDDLAATSTYGWRLTRDGQGDAYISTIAGDVSIAIDHFIDSEFFHLAVQWYPTISSFIFYVDGEYKGRFIVNPTAGVGDLSLSVGQFDIGAPAVGTIRSCEVSFWENQYFTAKDVKKLYCGGLQLSAPDSTLFNDTLLTTIHKNSGNRTEETPIMITEDADEFIYLEFPKYMKSADFHGETTIDMYSEKYILEDF